MSREDLEAVRGAYDAWNRRDMEAMLAAFAPDFEFQTSGVFPGLDPLYRGHEGWRKFWRDFSGTWESILISVRELRDCGERVLGFIAFEARGRDGLTVHRQAGNVWTFRDGLVVRLETHAGWTEALEAVGLRE
jgi:ketosteroid isomerase-like protein